MLGDINDYLIALSPGDVDGALIVVHVQSAVLRDGKAALKMVRGSIGTGSLTAHFRRNQGNQPDHENEPSNRAQGFGIHISSFGKDVCGNAHTITFCW